MLISVETLEESEPMKLKTVKEHSSEYGDMKLKLCSSWGLSVELYVDGRDACCLKSWSTYTFDEDGNQDTRAYEEVFDEAKAFYNFVLGELPSPNCYRS